MNVLPKSNVEFTKKDYWDSFFVKRGTPAFEWYGEFNELHDLLVKYVKPNDTILVVGCGNSNLSVDLYSAGYRNMVNIDISNVAIKQMQRKCKKKPGLIFKQMDVQNMEFEDGKFSVVLDKGTFDALMPNSDEKSVNTINRMMQEIDRVLRVGGRYVCVSLLQKHILHYMLEKLPLLGWLIRICRCHNVEPVGHSLPVFIVVCTKLKKIPNFKPVFEVVLSSDTVQRLNSQVEMIDAISVSQQAALLCSGLARQNISDSGEATIDLALPNNPIPRYSIVVTDKKCKKLPEAMTYAGFVVPQGREREWLFGTREGRELLRERAGVDRLAIVLLHRGHKYNNLQEVQDEVRDAIRSIAPAETLVKKTKIPFLSVGSDLGNRQEIARGTSKMSGEYIVEDAEGDNGTIFRRLIFLQNQNVVQSEAKLMKSAVKPGEKKVDVSSLSCDHHVYMTIGLCMVLMDRPAGNVNALLIGLGGGGLSMFIHKYFPQVSMTVVDIDDEVKRIASNHFSLVEDNRLKVQICDGCEYLRSSDAEKFDAILFDVDSKDSSKGLSCPPEIFISADVITNTKRCLASNGIFILNFACRTSKLRQNLFSLLHNTFESVSSVKLKEEINEIIYCRNHKADALPIDKVASFYNSVMSRGSGSKNVVELDELLDIVVKD